MKKEELIKAFMEFVEERFPEEDAREAVKRIGEDRIKKYLFWVEE